MIEVEHAAPKSIEDWITYQGESITLESVRNPGFEEASLDLRHVNGVVRLASTVLDVFGNLCKPHRYGKRKEPVSNLKLGVKLRPTAF